MLKRITVPGSSTWITDKGVLVMSANNCFQTIQTVEKPRLILVSGKHFEEQAVLASFSGQRNVLLRTIGDATFVGLDNQLLMSKDLETWESVLATPNQRNFFWHMTESRDGTLYAQEYGFGLTGIYKTSDEGRRWKQVINTKSIDRRATHFHSIAYDRYRDLLIATLGDSNMVKIAVSEDNGDTWRSIYSSAFQCLPIVVAEDHVFFGMDSAISRGLVVWNPSENKMEIIHLNYVGKTAIKDDLQSSDLKLLSNGIWLMSTGKGSLLSSSDLRNWQMLHLGEKDQFEANMISNDTNGIVSAALSSKVIILELKALKTSKQEADVTQYRALLPRIKSLGYITKKKIAYAFELAG